MRYLICILSLLLAFSCGSLKRKHYKPEYRLGQLLTVNNGFFRRCQGFVKGFSSKYNTYYLDLACPNYESAYRRGKGFEWIKANHLETAYDE